MIVLTRDPDGNRRWAHELELAGYQVFQAPMIQTAPVSLSPEITGILSRLSAFHWLVLTSAKAVPALQTLMRGAGITLGPIPPVAAVGESTAHAARAAGWDVKFLPRTPTSSTLAADLAPVSGRRILLARTAIANSGPADTLRRRGARVTDLPVYTTMPCADPNPELEQSILAGRVTCLVFASPSAVAGLTQSLTHTSLSAARELSAVAVGPTTTEALQSANFVKVHSAAQPSIGALMDTLAKVK